MRTFVFCFLAMLCQGAFAAERYHINNVLLMQPEAVFEQRVGDADALAQYVDRLGTVVDVNLSVEPSQVPTSGFIVVAVRPGGSSRTWLDFSPALRPELAARIKADLEQVVPMPTKDGVVVFAIKASLWGAEQSGQQSPAPAEWKAATKGIKSPIEIGALIDRVWPIATAAH